MRLSSANGQHEFPGEVHQLIHAQARQSAANPDEDEDRKQSLAKNQIYEGTKVRNESGAGQPPRNSVMPRPLMANMPRYSPRKKSANLKPEYSM